MKTLGLSPALLRAPQSRADLQRCPSTGKDARTSKNSEVIKVRFGSILLKKSKIENFKKSRKGQLLVVSDAASLCRTRTKVCDRF